MTTKEKEAGWSYRELRCHADVDAVRVRPERIAWVNGLDEEAVRVGGNLVIPSAIGLTSHEMPEVSILFDYDDYGELSVRISDVRCSDAACSEAIRKAELVRSAMKLEDYPHNLPPWAAGVVAEWMVDTGRTGADVRRFLEEPHHYVSEIEAAFCDWILKGL